MAHHKDMVNHPQHYGGDTTYEVIKVLEAWGLDFDFDLGNAVKYIARTPKSKDDREGVEGLADRLEDLKKAQWYLRRRIKRMEAQK